MTALAIPVLLRPRTQALQFMWRCEAAQSNKKRVLTMAALALAFLTMAILTLLLLTMAVLTLAF